MVYFLHGRQHYPDKVFTAVVSEAILGELNQNVSLYKSQHFSRKYECMCGQRFRFYFKKGSCSVIFFISFLFLFFHVVAVHSAPIRLIYMSVCCTEIEFDMYVCLFLIVY